MLPHKPLLSVLKGCGRARLFVIDVFKAAQIQASLYKAFLFFICSLPYITPGNYAFKTTMPAKEMVSVYAMKLKK